MLRTVFPSCASAKPPAGRCLTRALPPTREDAASLVLQGSVALPGDSLVLPTLGDRGLPRAEGPAPGAEPVGPGQWTAAARAAREPPRPVAVVPCASAERQRAPLEGGTGLPGQRR